MLSRCYEPLSPPNPQGLPDLQKKRVGRLSYVRRIAPELQSYDGNRKVVRHLLGLISTKQADPAVIQAGHRVHREGEELMKQAKAAEAELLAERPRFH